MKALPVVQKAKPLKKGNWVPTMCWLCVEGPDLLRVRVVDGVAVSIEGNATLPGYDELTPNQGRICTKPFGLIQKVYNPYRLKNPVKRTNPQKGRGIDPGWVEVTWEEALDMVAERLKQIRATDSRKLIVNFPTVQNRMHSDFTLTAFFDAFGPTQKLVGGGSCRCDVAEHMFGNVIHGAFQCEPDLPLCNYLLWMGGNESASGGAAQNVLYSDARSRGLKAVIVDPVFSLTASKAQEWLPIRPGTDTAFLLALIQVIINEMGVYDVQFLKEMTNSPYLVGPDGYFVRDKTTNKALMWDLVDQRARTFDDDGIKDVVLEGTYVVEGVECRPAFQLLKDHVRRFTPEWAKKITDIPAATIRRIAGEFIENAKIGSTINVGGMTLPYRPVATKTGRGVTGVMRGYQFILALHILVALAGALEVPGSHCGGRRRLTRPGSRGINPGPDGMPRFDSYEFTWPPVSYDGSETLLPYGKTYGRINHLGFLNLAQAPENFPLPPLPEAFIRCRTNPLVTFGEPEVIEKALKSIPFVVSISYALDEVSELADVVLPEHTELERYEPLCSSIKPALAKKFAGVFLTQPAVEPVHNTRDIHYMLTELADRLGILREYNEHLNSTMGLQPLFKLDPGRKYSTEELVDKQCKSATDGVHGLEWFKDRGAMFGAVPVEEHYGAHLEMKARKLRYSIPYMEDVKRTGEKLAKNLAKVGVKWWPTTEYVALPVYIPSVIEDVPPEYDFYVTTCRLPQFAHGTNVDIPWFNELARLFPGQENILMNEDAARQRGIRQGDEIWVESPVGRVKRKVDLTQGIRPDTILIAGQFGQWATPVAKDTGRVSQTVLTPLRLDWTDPVTGEMQGGVVKAKVYKEGASSQ